MNRIRVMQILKVTIANLCDVAAGQPANTSQLWDFYKELEQGIREMKTEALKG